MSIRIIIAALLSINFSILTCADSAASNQKIVLAPDTNHDSVVNQQTIKKGQDLFLIKPNPTKLMQNSVVLQTRQFNLYTAATLNDLQDPEAFKKLLFAKMSSDGTIKVYTLRNLGYVNMQAVQNPNGSTEVFLINLKGKMEKINQISFKPPLPPIYDPTKTTR